MADSLLDLGTTPVFPLEPNWVSNPTTNISVARRVIGYPGTIQALFQITDDVPVTFTEKFTIYNKTDENTILNFFHARKGRNQRFWVKHPRKHFTLKETASSGAVTMVCEPNNADKQWQGYERIYIVMGTGDILTRKVNSVTYDAVNEEINLTLNNSLDRDVTTSNQILIGRLLLCRFDSDEMNIRWHSTVTSDFSLKFYELVKEYSSA